MNNTVEYYNNNAKSLAKRYASANVDTVQNLLLQSFSAKSNLLEIGCGSGRDANFMINKDYNVIGIDASKEMINEAKSKHPLLKDILKVIVIPDELNFHHKSFDGVYSIATLMHLKEKNIETTIKKIYNFLKDKGIFLFSVSIQRDDVDDKNKDNKGRYFTTMDENKWLQICHSIGFKTIKTVVTNDGLNRDGIIWLTCVMEK
ncbi:class I SAM-dependent methyltransferase [Sulfurimonas sp. SAG-AH-194-C21]|nr:class I SAM-dependent methyltransferase [Sulfurimonas sp. SAG-AH-194-C21]MDF1884113.1 class I SAM-dependent methyltransferase [Sulfurimonas sp. SAG-AH-194-C21]